MGAHMDVGSVHNRWERLWTGFTAGLDESAESVPELG
jgi:hypothetical protein